MCGLADIDLATDMRATVLVMTNHLMLRLQKPVAQGVRTPDVADFERRRELVRDGVDQAAAKAGGHVVEGESAPRARPRAPERRRPMAGQERLGQPCDPASDVAVASELVGSVV